MSGSKRKITAFRITFSLLSALAIFFAVYNLINFSSTTTDENLFADVGSRYMTRQSHSAPYYPVEPGDRKSGPVDGARVEYGIVPAGSLISEAGGVKFSGKADVKAQLAKSHGPGDTIDIIYLLRYPKLRYIKSRVTIGSLNEDFYTQIPSTVILRSVVKGGASDRAGLKVGDLIYKVNGNYFKDAWDAHTYIVKSKGGDLLHYSVFRGAESREIKVRLAIFGVSYIVLILVIVGVFLLLLSFFLALKRYYLKPARLLSIAFLVLGSLIGFLILNNNAYVASTRGWLAGIGYLFGMTFALSFIFPLMTYAHYFFPKENALLVKKKFLVRLPLIIGALTFVLMIAAAFIFKRDYSVYNRIFTGGLILNLLYLGIVKIAYRKSRSKEIAVMIRPVYFAIIVNVLMMVGQIIIAQNTGSQNQALFSTLLLIPLAYLYVIMKYRLLDIEVRLKRNLQYLVVTAFWQTVIFAGLILIIFQLSRVDWQIPNFHVSGTTIEVLDTPVDKAKKDLYEKIIIIVLAFLVSLICWKLSKNIQRRIDIKFNRAKFDYQLLSNEISEIIRLKLSTGELAAAFIEKLGKLIQLKSAGFIFFKKDNILLQEYYGIKSDSFEEFCLAVSDRLLETINRFNGSFRTDYMPDDIKKVFLDFHFQYVTPVRSKGVLVGAIFLGEKLSESTFHNEDFKFLSYISYQFAVAIENAYLYDDLANQERIKQELEIAKKIQLASLPQEIPDIKGLDIAGTSIPAYEVGGDFYDFIWTEPDNITIVVGDVSGKGTSAALHMSKAQGIIRTLSEFRLSPKQLLVKTNELIFKYLEKTSFITLLIAAVDTAQKSICLSRAGHLPLYYYNAAAGEVEKILPRGLVLGVKNDGIFGGSIEERIINYNSNDVFVFVSDGVTEAKNKANQEFEEDRLINVITSNHQLTAVELKHKIIKEVNEFSKNHYQHDDITVVVVKI